MKKIIFIFILHFTILSYSQDYIDIIGKETCECVQDKKLVVSKNNITEVKATLGLCMMTSYTKYKDKMDPTDKVEFGDKKGMTRLGENVGVKMLNYCPELIMNLGESFEKNEEVIDNDSIVLEGEFLEQKISDFISISLRDKTGRIQNLLFLYHFKNSEMIINNLLRKNEKIIISYIEQEFYDPKSKDFKYYKIINSLSKI